LSPFVLTPLHHFCIFSLFHEKTNELFPAETHAAFYSYSHTDTSALDIMQEIMYKMAVGD
jgi:hypothetical protein